MVGPWRSGKAKQVGKKECRERTVALEWDGRSGTGKIYKRGWDANGCTVFF
jgi:hypothetical protein